jgi:hypothetical protein
MLRNPNFEASGIIYLQVSARQLTWRPKAFQYINKGCLLIADFGLISIVGAALLQRKPQPTAS